MSTDYEYWDTSPPSTLAAGDTWEWLHPSTSDRYDDNYTAEVRLTNASNVYTTTGYTYQTSYSSYAIQMAASVTSGYSAGDYTLVVSVISGDNRYRLGVYNVEITADLSQAAADLRSDAQKVLDALTASINGLATDNQLAMSIGGRSISRMSLDELINAKERYEQIVAKEQAAQDRVDGKAARNTVRVRFI